MSDAETTDVAWNYATSNTARRNKRSGSPECEPRNSRLLAVGAGHCNPLCSALPLLAPWLHDDSRNHLLPPVAPSHFLPLGTMRGHHRQQRRRSQRPLFSSVFQYETRQFLRFLGRDLPQGGCTLILIRRNDSDPSLSKPRHHGGDGSGVTCRQPGIDRREDGTSCRALTGDEQLHFGIVQAAQCVARARPDVGSIFSYFGGRPVFEGASARPVRSSRYWSLSHPLSRSRSFQ